MNTYVLTERQRDIVHHLRDKATGQKRQLLEDVLNNSLAKNDIETVCGILHGEHMMHGLRDEKFNPNEYGRELEELLDVINRPRLS